MASLLAGLGFKALGIALKVLKITLPIPLFVILAAAAWAHFDKGSAARKAVDRAVTQLVAGAEIDAAHARAAALQQIIDEKNRLAARDREALARFEDAQRTAAEQEGHDDELADLAALPAPAACTVDGALLERLRQ